MEPGRRYKTIQGSMLRLLEVLRNSGAVKLKWRNPHYIPEWLKKAMNERQDLEPVNVEYYDLIGREQLEKQNTKQKDDTNQ